MTETCACLDWFGKPCFYNVNDLLAESAPDITDNQNNAWYHSENRSACVQQKI